MVTILSVLSIIQAGRVHCFDVLRLDFGLGIMGSTEDISPVPGNPRCDASPLYGHLQSPAREYALLTIDRAPKRDVPAKLLFETQRIHARG